jgi:hypothetical protein
VETGTGDFDEKDDDGEAHIIWAHKELEKTLAAFLAEGAR